MSIKRRAIAIVIVWFVVVVAALAVTLLLSGREPLRHALPSSATDIQYERQDFLGGELVYLKARITPDAFEEYVKTLKLTPYYPDLDDPTAMTEWTRMEVDPTWWTPPESIDGTFAFDTPLRLVAAKYVDGWLWAGSAEVSIEEH